MATIISRHPFVTFGVATLLLWLAWGAMGMDYDAGGGATVLFLLAYVLGLPFLFAAAAVTAVLGDTAVAAVAPIFWIPLGFTPYILADWLRGRRRARRNARAV
jgi:hypothetical protein